MIKLVPLLSAEEAKHADKYTILSTGISRTELMERAGFAIAQEVESLLSQTLSPIPKVPVVILCGPGNNGGDGWVTARRLWQNGIRVLLLTLCPIDSLKGDAELAARQFLAAAANDGWTLPDLSSCVVVVSKGKTAQNLLNQTSPLIIVDAIFGTGLKRPAEGLFDDVIKAINQFTSDHRPKAHVLSVDMPSGLPSDGQRGSGAHIEANSTLAIQFRKISHLSGPHWLSCGVVKCADIGIKLSKSAQTQALLAQDQSNLDLLRAPHPSFYKGHYGHVGVLCGSFGLQGASQLASYAALRSGAGLVSLLVPSEIKDSNLGMIPEIMLLPIATPLNTSAFERFTAFVIGPGIGEDSFDLALEIIRFAFKHSRPCVIDAGGLGLLDRAFKNSKPANSQIIATPHPGEAARILKIQSSDVEKDRIKSAQALLKKSAQWPVDVTWVLKGACPIIAHREHGVLVLEGGVTTLSVGGSGDVLAGLCAALFAQTNSAFDAAVLGVATHLEVGRNLAKRESRGFLAHEIADEIPQLLFKTGVFSSK